MMVNWRVASKAAVMAGLKGPMKADKKVAWRGCLWVAGSADETAGSLAVEWVSCSVETMVALMVGMKDEWKAVLMEYLKVVCLAAMTVELRAGLLGDYWVA